MKRFNNKGGCVAHLVMGLKEDLVPIAEKEFWLKKDFVLYLLLKHWSTSTESLNLTALLCGPVSTYVSSS